MEHSFFLFYFFSHGVGGGGTLYLFTSAKTEEKILCIIIEQGRLIRHPSALSNRCYCFLLLLTLMSLLPLFPPRRLNSSFLWQDVQYPEQYKSKPRIRRIRTDWKCQFLKKEKNEVRRQEIRRVIAASLQGLFYHHYRLLPVTNCFDFPAPVWWRSWAETNASYPLTL